MIDYFMHKKCQLVTQSIRYEGTDPRCVKCIWFDDFLRKCIFSLKFPRSVTINEIIKRMMQVDEEIQKTLSEPWKRLVLNDDKNRDAKGNTGGKT